MGREFNLFSAAIRATTIMGSHDHEVEKELAIAPTGEILGFLFMSFRSCFLVFYLWHTCMAQIFFCMIALALHSVVIISCCG